MKFRPFISLGLVLALSVSGIGQGVTASAAAISQEAESAVKTKAREEISEDDISVTWEDSRVYSGLTLGRYKTVATYGVKGYEDVPFLSAKDYLNVLYEGREQVSMEDGVMTVSMNGTKAVIDPAADTIRFEDPARFRSAGVINGGVIDENEFNVITFSSKNESSMEESEPLLISLKEYHMPAIAYEDTVIMPFLALQNTFGGVSMNTNLAYNGKDYFNAFEANSFLLNEENAGAGESPYIKAIYSGPFSEKEETTQAYADYGYYSVCLLLDLTFGHKEERNITTFDEYFTRMNAKAAMTSTDPAAAMTAEFMLFNYLFDSGHDAFFTFRNVFGKEALHDIAEARDLADSISRSEEGKRFFEAPAAEEQTGGTARETAGEAAGEAHGEGEGKTDPTTEAILGALIEKGLKIPEILPLFIWDSYLSGKRPEGYGDERLDYAGDTAVIYFNAFKDDTDERNPSYYLDPINEEDTKKSTFAFFYKAFEDIKAHEEVKNVVINIADNGGGRAAALVQVLGFLSEDGEVRITDKDLMANSYREEYYHVDTNLDGVADDQDGFGGQYKFYILCSGESYSCGNALPYFAQQDGLAVIIGTNPGGGDCVVGSFIDAYGRCAAFSSMLKLGRDDGSGFVSNEKATVADFNMMPSILDKDSVPWFDPEGIAGAVRQYEEGRTEAVYNDKNDEEKLTELLGGILEKIGGR